MITKRIIPCLDVKDGRVVKGVNFLGLCDVSSPVKLAEYYSESGADELVFYDITASFEGRALFTNILTEVARKIFIPLTVGGGINTLSDFDRVLKCGADKVSVNSGAIKNPALIEEAAKRYGDQCVVISCDVKRVENEFRVFSKGGREDPTQVRLRNARFFRQTVLCQTAPLSQSYYPFANVHTLLLFSLIRIFYHRKFAIIILIRLTY